ncbi:sensor histidine kinase [Lentzea flava]|uniref:sensor histidine kinase n=1 Tax=Lentzea flava TaxID=103732 RepID=UPI001670F6E9|nr:ATP-binding protein [Lentzea flava]MCP2197139.1 Histidine kinase-, DNA gyrase B-, and HSP90-like ATPase [Lentzea flava]
MPTLVFALTVIAELGATALSWGFEPLYDTVMYAIYAIVMAGAGALIARRSVIGWLFLWFALLNALAADLGQAWGLRELPGGPIALWISLTSWLPSGFGWILTFVLFPDGKAGRWRPLLWVGGISTVLAMAGWAFSPDLGRSFPDGRNPMAVESLPTAAVFTVGITLFLAALGLSVLALILRFLRSEGIRRQQLKWFVFAAALAGVGLPMSFALWYVTPAAGVIAAVVLTGLVVAACLAILRYRLFDVDVVISRTISYGVLTVLLVAAYAVTVVVVGTAAGRGSSWATAAATLVAALAFRPLRARVQDVVDRRFNRARYDARRRMADFLEALRAGRAAPEEVRGVLREVLADPGLELLVYLPESREHVDLDGRTRAVTGSRVVIERDGQPLGVVVHTTPQAALVREVVEAGGLAVEIARLRVELRRQLAEVRASRARIVAAGDAERRRIQRDLHDGAQQRLVAIGLALRHAQHQLTTDAADQAGRTIDDAVAELAVAIGELRDLARGLQLDGGLRPAFDDLARRTPLHVQVRAPDERFAENVEAAAYFVGCEALTNAVKHAKATTVALTVAQRDGNLVVTVTDDGIGGAAPSEGSGLTGLADRVAALGGTLRVDSAPGTGTTVIAEVPCES